MQFKGASIASVRFPSSGQVVSEKLSILSGLGGSYSFKDGMKYMVELSYLKMGYDQSVIKKICKK